MPEQSWLAVSGLWSAIAKEQTSTGVDKLLMLFSQDHKKGRQEP